MRATNFVSIVDSAETKLYQRNTNQFLALKNIAFNHHQYGKDLEATAKLQITTANYYQFQNINLDSAIHFNRLGVQTAYTDSIYKYMAEGHGSLSIIFENIGSMDSAGHHSKKAIYYAKISKDYKSVLHKYGNYAHILRSKNDILTAKSILVEGLNWSVDHNIQHPYAHNMLILDLASLYFHNEQFNLALQQIEKAKTYFDTRTQLENGHLIINQLLGVIYSFKNELDSSLKYFSRALFIAEEIKNYSVRFTLLNSICKNYIQLGNLELAKKYNEEFRKDILSRGNNIYLDVYYLNKSEIALKESQGKKTLNLLKNIKHDSKLFKNDLFKIRYHNVKCNAFELTNDFLNATHELNQLRTLQNEKYAKELNHQSEELIAQFKSRSNNLLIQQNKERLSLDIKSIEVSRSRAQVVALISFIIGITILIILYSFYTYKKNLKMKAIFNENTIVNLKESFVHGTKQLIEVRNELNSKNSLQEIEELFTRLKGKDIKAFEMHFDNVFPNFQIMLKSINSKLSESEIQYCKFKRLKLTNKEISQILDIHPDSVKKALQRVRKKLNFSKNQEFSLFLDNL
jgi:DNA-binding CsgD family transcriptional regulator